MKPLSVYKLSRAEAALRRLESATAALDAAAASLPAAGGAAPAVDATEIADLKRRCGELEAAARAASEGIDEAASRLSRLLEE